MKIKNKTKAGDIILTHNYSILGWIIRIITNSYWNHSCLYLGNGKVLDILLRGIQIIDYDKHYKNKIEHKFIRVRGLSDDKRYKICKHAKKFIGKPYNFLLTLRITNTIGSFNCSEFIAKIFADNGIILHNDLLAISPADLDKSNKTYDINNPPSKLKELEILVRNIIQIMGRCGISFEEIGEKIKDKQNEKNSM